MSNCSIFNFIPSIVFLSWDASLVVIEQAITGRETPQARPNATLLQNTKREIREVQNTENRKDD
jgi:hypothetical protein